MFHTVHISNPSSFYTSNKGWDDGEAASVLQVPMMDIAGRRPLLLFPMLAMILDLALITVCRILQVTCLDTATDTQLNITVDVMRKPIQISLIRFIYGE